MKAEISLNSFNITVIIKIILLTILYFTKIDIAISNKF